MAGIVTLDAYYGKRLSEGLGEAFERFTDLEEGG